MTSCMESRGPDDSGVVQIGPCCFGHRRLSIVDLTSTGHQPMSSADGSVWVVLNGELYGFAELVRELRNAGREFVSKSDTEVLLHGYEEWGMDGLLRRIGGMFAFALYDQRTNILYLARDRFGEKPLFYMRVGNDLRFASTTRALFRGIDQRPQLSADGVLAYLHLNFSLPGVSPIEGVQTLPPGSYARIAGESESIVKYWRPTFTVREGLSANAWIDLVDDGLRAAVRSQLVADVPVGCLLSGGVDSSLVASYAAEAEASIQLFTVQMSDAKLDESAKASIVARKVGGQHRILSVEPMSVAEFIAFQGSFSEPLGDASSVALRLISDYASQYVKVVLTGDGGDELFGGYRSVTLNLQAEKYRQLLGSVPARAVLTGIERSLSPFPGRPLLRRAATTARLLRSNLREAHLGRSFIPKELRSSLPGGRLREALTRNRYRAEMDAIWERSESGEALNKMLNFDLQTWLLGDYLPKVDTATMGASLEARAPLLDYRLAELAFTMPPEVKLLNGEGKGLLKALLRRRLDSDVALLNQRKQGFVVPIDSWLDTSWAELVRELPSSRLVEEGWVSREGVLQVIAGARRDPARFSRIRYALVVLNVFHQQMNTWHEN